MNCETTTRGGFGGQDGGAGVVRAGMAVWVRERMLPRLVPIGPEEIGDLSRTGRLRVLRRLFGALRGERARGRSGHWSYSLDRHIGLVQAVAAERQGFLEATGEPFAFAHHRDRPGTPSGEGPDDRGRSGDRPDDRTPRGGGQKKTAANPRVRGGA